MFLNKTKIYWFILTYIVLVIMISIITRSFTYMFLLLLHIFLIKKARPSLLERPNEADRRTYGGHIS